VPKPAFVLVLPGLAAAVPAWAADGPSLDFDAVWHRGDAVSQITLLVLAAMSIATWSVVLVKLVEQSRLLSQARRASAALADPAATQEGRAQALPAAGPFRALAAAGLAALRRHQAGLADTVDRHTWLSLALNRALAPILSQAGDGLALLATVASTAPFVGLFGTVWSIHRALAEIGLTGQATIERVAGPVGESLVMTALGLAVAVPAVLAHNALARRHKQVIEAVRGFGAALHAELLADGVAGREPSAAGVGRLAPALA